MQQKIHFLKITYARITAATIRGQDSAQLAYFRPHGISAWEAAYCCRCRT